MAAKHALDAYQKELAAVQDELAKSNSKLVATEGEHAAANNEARELREKLDEALQKAMHEKQLHDQHGYSNQAELDHVEEEMVALRMQHVMCMQELGSVNKECNQLKGQLETTTSVLASVEKNAEEQLREKNDIIQKLDSEIRFALFAADNEQFAEANIFLTGH